MSMTDFSFPHMFACYTPISLHFSYGKGSWLYTENGSAYLDFTSGIAVNCLGHAHPCLIQSLSAQAQKLWHTSNLFLHHQQEALAQKLCEHSFADKVFFVNSGAEAVECAIKTARHYHYAKGNKEKCEIITFTKAFHGRSLATLAAGGQAKYLEGFAPAMPGFVQLPFGDVDAVAANISPKTAAILLEPIQGEGGVRAWPIESLQKLRQLCSQHDFLLIFDEVQSGVGRSGRFFSYQWSDIQPDILATAKGLGGGFPLGACLATKQAAESMTPGTHGSTFGGNLLAMAVGQTIVDIVSKQEFLNSVQKKAAYLGKTLQALAQQFHKLLGGVNGKGLMMGVECVIPNSQIIAACREEKLLILGAGENHLRFLPPLNIEQEELELGLQRFQTALEKLKS